MAEVMQTHLGESALRIPQLGPLPGGNR